MSPCGCPKPALPRELEVRPRPANGHGVRLNSFTELAQLFERVQKQRRIDLLPCAESALTHGRPVRDLPGETAVRSPITQIHEGANQIERVVMAAAAEGLMYGC